MQKLEIGKNAFPDLSPGLTLPITPDWIEITAARSGRLITSSRRRPGGSIRANGAPFLFSGRGTRMDLIQASAVSKRFGGIVALSRAEFHAAAGEVHALLGENGAGKSTFIQILAGALRPDEGTILLRGEPFVASNPSAAQRAGVSAVFQELSLVPDLTVEQNIWFRREPLTPFGTVRARQDARRYARALRALPRPRQPPRHRGPPADARASGRSSRSPRRSPATPPSSSSTRRRRRSPRARPSGCSISRGASRRRGMLVIYISHRLAEVRHLAERITVFRNGMTVAAHDTAVR